MFYLKNIFILLLTIFYISATAQYTNTKHYPQGYFMYPVKAKMGLNANFGELRPNHWHMGLDCKTDQHENADIVAAADGYIAKIKIEPFGFGRAIYINHPNGFTTLYAHCNDFYPELDKWVKLQQYAKKSWRIFLDSIPANLFIVKKGKFIAKSGNTGGSQGPHLHFEIRDTKSEKVLNPLLFGFNIPDNVKPNIQKIVVYDRCQGIFEQVPKIIATTGTTAPPINIKTEQVSFAIAATDAVSGSTNPNGIYQATIFDNGLALCGFQLDSISYDETRYLNANIDYKMKANGGSFVQHLSELPGNKNGIYKNFKNNGIVNLLDGIAHIIKIEVKDPAGNTTVVQFSIINKDIANTRCKDEFAASYAQYFLPNQPNILENSFVKFSLSEKALYDSIHFKYANAATALPDAFSNLQMIHYANVPVHNSFTINIKANKVVPETFKNRMIIKRFLQGGKFETVKAISNGDWYSADFKGFGNFILLHDTKPPTIVPSGIKDGANLSKATGFSFTIKDENEETKNFKATLDGNWLLFTNDKGIVFKHKFDEQTTPGPHQLKIYIEDEAGNPIEQTYNFVR